MARLTSDNCPETSPPRFTILLVSAAALSYEILLMRLFSIVQYHHFAYMVISLALLGYGASGSFLVFFRQRFLQNFPVFLIANICLFGATAVGCFLGGQHLLFNPEEILWNTRHWLKLFALYVLLALPFFFAANCIALTFSRYREKISAVYAADLLGAGLGSMIVIGFLYIAFPVKILLMLGSIVLLIPVIALIELGLQSWKPTFLFLALAAIPLLLPADLKELLISPYKGLSQQMRIQGSSILREVSSPLGFLTLVENKKIPFRFAPGLSLAAESEPPEQLGLFTDGDGLSVITKFSGSRKELAHLDMLTSALPYHLQQLENVLILGAGGGSAVLQALNGGAGSISAVELNPQVVELVRQRREFSGGIFAHDKVQLFLGDGRSFVAGSEKKFDLIQVPILDAFGNSSAGLYSLHENYLYTLEALKEYINHLTPEGYLCINTWIRLPPRDTLKLLATAIAALEGIGLENPGDHLVMVRSWQTGTLLIKKSAFREAEIGAMQEFCRSRFFDPVFFPGMKPREANRYNIVSEPYFYEGAVNLLGRESGSFIKRYKFNIAPSTDDRPYFANFFKWQTLPELLRLKGRGGIGLLDSGYLILVITLIQAITASLLLILLPVLPGTTDNIQITNWTRPRTALYFFSIGLGFLFLEIAFMQKYILYLGHPLFAVAAVLAVFLVFAGLGSQFVKKRRFHPIRPVAIILCLGVLEPVLSGWFYNLPAGSVQPLKILIAVLLLGPLAFCMGMVFPLALTDIGGETPGLVPWAWAVNGCASVIGAVLATLLAVHFGFTTVVFSALALYGIAAASFPARQKKEIGT